MRDCEVLSFMASPSEISRRPLLFHGLSFIYVGNCYHYTLNLGSHGLPRYVAACELGSLSSGDQFICLKNVRIYLLFSSDIPKIGTQSKEYTHSI